MGHPTGDLVTPPIPVCGVHQVLAGVLFRGQDSVCVAFGTAFWAPFVQAYEASFLEQAQHISSGLLHERQEAVKGLEAAAVQLGFTPAGGGRRQREEGGECGACWSGQLLWVQSWVHTSSWGLVGTRHAAGTAPHW